MTTSPYKYVRHPFYLAFFLASIGGSLVAANWFVFVSGLVPAGFLIARTRIEEEKLVERFGELRHRWDLLEQAIALLPSDKPGGVRSLVPEDDAYDVSEVEAAMEDQ